MTKLLSVWLYFGTRARTFKLYYRRRFLYWFWVNIPRVAPKSKSFVPIHPDFPLTRRPTIHPFHTSIPSIRPSTAVKLLCTTYTRARISLRCQKLLSSIPYRLMHCLRNVVQSTILLYTHTYTCEKKCVYFENQL